MRASLLDRTDLAAVRAACRRSSGPWGPLVACLLAPGVVQHDPADPAWPDRDRVVVGDAAAASALQGVLGPASGGAGRPGRPGTGHPGPAWLDATGGYALALARGMAAASDADGAVFRVWCLLGEGAVGDGPTWEAASDAPAGSLCTVALARPAASARLRALLAAAGWRLARARADEPAEVLGGLDRLLLPGRPAALVAEWRQR